MAEARSEMQPEVEVSGTWEPWGACRTGRQEAKGTPQRFLVLPQRECAVRIPPGKVVEYDNISKHYISDCIAYKIEKNDDNNINNDSHGAFLILVPRGRGGSRPSDPDFVGAVLHTHVSLLRAL